MMNLKIYDILAIKMGLLSSDHPDLSDKAIFSLAKKSFDEAVVKGLVVADYRKGTFELTPKGKKEFNGFWYGDKEGAVAEVLSTLGKLPSGIGYKNG